MQNKIVLSVIFTILFFILISQVTCESNKLIIDTDAGPEDALAILLAIIAQARNDSPFEVIAITCTYGITEEKNVEQNVLKILTMANVTNIPVYGGATKPLIEEVTFGHRFGNDGLGDFDFNNEIKINVDNSTHAAHALVNLAKQYSEKLSILVLGPLTNIALAVSLDPNFVDNVDSFYIMGGSSTGRGNMKPGIEFNFGTDPHSAFIVFNSMGYLHAELYPWDLAMNSPVSMSWRINTLGAINSTIIDFLNKAEGPYLNGRNTDWLSVETMATAMMLWKRELYEDSVFSYVSVLDEGVGKGTTVVDYYNLLDKKSNAEIIKAINIKKFKDRLISYFS